MKSIWYFVGLILAAMGLVLLATGAYELVVPPPSLPVLGELRTNLWWGIVMLVAGAIFLLIERKTRDA